MGNPISQGQHPAGFLCCSPLDIEVNLYSLTKSTQTTNSVTSSLLPAEFSIFLNEELSLT